MVEAYQILQDETCPTCGNPIWICRSENPNLRFKMESSVCFADREQRLWEERKHRNAKNAGKKDGWEPAPGEQWFAVPTMVNGEHLPTRNDYYRELAAKME